VDTSSPLTFENQRLFLLAPSNLAGKVPNAVLSVFTRDLRLLFPHRSTVAFADA